ncbi:uncharacterized protein J3D65DRAFT_331789 [Phyllosticta citribraziliensis]|uniref:Uncharacterized protein n=1 Tax=Phyllosticta citribraziliensis TaxID=989973 RepID=A0ABR1LTL6_9PEZI
MQVCRLQRQNVVSSDAVQCAASCPCGMFLSWDFASCSWPRSSQHGKMSGGSSANFQALGSLMLSVGCFFQQPLSRPEMLIPARHDWLPARHRRAFGVGSAGPSSDRTPSIKQSRKHSLDWQSARRFACRSSTACYTMVTGSDAGQPSCNERFGANLAACDHFAYGFTQHPTRKRRPWRLKHCAMLGCDRRKECLALTAVNQRYCR